MRSSVLRRPQATAGNSREVKQAKEQKRKNSNFPAIPERNKRKNKTTRKNKPTLHGTKRKISADKPTSATVLGHY